MPKTLLTLNQVNESHYSLIASVLKTHLTASSCLALHGDLGAGKTSFARCFIQSYLNSEHMDVPSPTYTLAQHYPAHGERDPDIWHYDFYRLENENEIIEIGFDENLDNSISIVEWPEKIANHLPLDTLLIQFTSSEDKNSRQLNFISSKPWDDLLKEIKQTPILEALIENENQ